ncbi:peptidase inhibitor family I36 protein [Streptomyces sp. NPDC006654]|uniref:peptidase inhibitor family I36 protein n=1 Tax=unclassified Streptomyces TaxID=2593676 RepID=UPI0033E3F2CC
MRTRTVGALASTVVMVSGLTLAAAPSASAADGLSQCPPGYACFWGYTGYNGTMGKVAGNNPDFSELISTDPLSCGWHDWDNCIESIANHGTQCTVYFYDDYNYGKSDRWHSLSRGDEVGNFATGYNDSGFNDVISSNKWCTS